MPGGHVAGGRALGVVKDQLDVVQRKAEFALTMTREAAPPAMAAHVDARHVLQGVIDKARVAKRIFRASAAESLGREMITLFACQDIEPPGRARHPANQDHFVIHVGSALV